MNTETWEKFDRIRGQGFRNAEEIAAVLQKEAIHFSPSELTAFGVFITGSFGRHADFFPAPDWLTAVFSTLGQGRTVNTICDPWAGIGLLIGVMQEVTQAKIALAFEQNTSHAALGKVLVGNAEWQVGSPIQLLSSQVNEIDLVASLLPWGAKASHPLTVRDMGGNDIVLGDDLGNQILISASMRLSAEGIGLFVVTPSFFISPRSVFQQFNALGLGLDAALALPSGTFTPHTNIPSYLVIVRKHPVTKMFVAQLSSDSNMNRQVLSNLAKGEEGGSLELGRFVDPLSFRGLDLIRVQERFDQAERLFGASAIPLEELATVINLGRFSGDFQFPKHENAIFIPLIGISDVVASLDGLTLKPQNYAQVSIDPALSDARFVARFLNSEFGKEIRNLSRSGVVIPKMNKQTLKELRVFLPDLQTQKTMLEVEARIAAEQNTLIGLQNELGQFQRELWANPQSVKQVDKRLSVFSDRLSESPKLYAVAGLDQWFETLPFPLASILRAWQATPSKDFKTKYEHLLHFFEATAEFISIILMSAFKSNKALFEQHKLKFKESMQKQNVSFRRATFGTWKFSVEYFGKQTRQLLSGSDDDRSTCAEIFSDSSNALSTTLSRIELTSILSDTNKMRNDWSGHGGVIGQEEAKLRNEQLLAKVQKLREVMADTWIETNLIQSLHCVMRNGVFENEVAVLIGSNSGFLKESRTMSTCLDVELLYLSRKDSTRALQLLPLMQIGPSPQSANNACYFYSRVDKGDLRFVSYHFIDQPERNMPSSMFVSLSDLWEEK
ncbi:MAG: hypothetical protein M0R70_14280 [Nitrospirae bacterium]|nr:hypothetical protein [Nitrospirota bacterium]